MKNLLVFLAATALLLSCSPKQYKPIELLPETEFRDLDTLEVSAARSLDEEEEMEDSTEELADQPAYNPSHKREHDLLHTKLDVRFDWKKEQVLGKATLTLKPYFYPKDQVTLDAKGFEIHKITFEGSNEPLKFDYDDGQQVTIHLGKTFTRDQEYKLFIDYTAIPAASGGSAAIQSDKGLYFINPQGDEPDKPQQIWTQGETESNSRWFPTIDKPNERTTQEIYVTVEDRFKTLSNGVLASFKKNADGTRTDYWKMDMPHAPYLFMLAIGEYAVVKDNWNGKPVEYYVEPKFEKYARSIFPNTPEMLSFFSTKLGVPYPWQKYAQVVVRDYVSGAMENTTAVVFGEFMQGTARELVDNLQNENIVSHEMFHHWFGDLVTIESWANLTLNEGFANYAEYLWLEHKHGREEADLHRMNEMQGYLSSAEGGVHPLIHFHHADKEDMFDAHSYNKGGLVLHMLRKYVGDEAFFAGLKLYLERHKFTDVEGHELRLAFEDVTGEDMNWFFNQWFFNQGQPDLNVESDYDEANKQVTVTVKQLQDGKEMPAVFELPVAVDIYVGGKATRHQVRINQREQTFTLPAAADPELILFDAEGSLLGTKNEEKSEEEYFYQFEHVPTIEHRIEALGKLSNEEDPKLKALFEKALDDKFWLVRMLGVEQSEVNEQTATRFAKLAETDPHSSVREAALSKLAETGDKKYAPLAVRAIEKDPAMKIVSAGLDALLALDKDTALATAKKLEAEDDEGIILALAGIYAETGDPAHLPFFEQKFDKVSGFMQITFIEQYVQLATNADPATMVQVAEKLKQIAVNDGKMFWMRFLSTKGINDMHAALSTKIEEEKDAAKATEMKVKDKELVGIIEAIKSWETDDRVKQMYAEFPNPALKP